MQDPIQSIVRDKYGSVASSGLSGEQAGVRAVAKAFGYSAGELDSIPAEANMGLSCGNPTAFASLRPGEVVVDLGSGGGLDVFLAAQSVGPEGRAIGIDMTPQMIDLARRNAALGPKPVMNVEFHLANIDALPLPDNAVDVVISNCVINLAPDKPAVFREIFRVLKPGGRVAVSDIALKKPLPPELGQDLMAYVGCIAGAIAIEDYRRGLAKAGFNAVHVADTGADLNAYAKVEGQGGCCSPAMATPPTPAEREPLTRIGATSSTAGASSPLSSLSQGCCDPTVPPPRDDSLHGRLTELLQRYDVNEYASSVRVYAVKPARLA